MDIDNELNSLIDKLEEINDMDLEENEKRDLTTHEKLDILAEAIHKLIIQSKINIEQIRLITERINLLSNQHNVLFEEISKKTKLNLVVENNSSLN